MNRTGIRLLLLGLVLAVGLPAAAPTQEAVMKIAKPTIFGALSRPSVRFTHADHGMLEGVTCLTCHHVIEKGKNVLDIQALQPGNPAVQCASCHKSARALQIAFHQTCITCHDAQKAAGRVTGPRACGECHVWGS